MANACFWILGRGASISNGLRWSVPDAWYAEVANGHTDRDAMIDRIKLTLAHEMDQPAAHGQVYQRLIDVLCQRTSVGWYHRFLTANWDTLLERELFPRVRTAGVVPEWLGQQSHVYHLNGTIEDGSPEHRSPFLLEIDDANERALTVEANVAYNQLLWSTCVVIVGMSFACATDQTFLLALNRVQDDVPLGEARILIVNPNKIALDEVCSHIGKALPAATIVPIAKSFDAFVDDGLLELADDTLTE